MGDFNASCQNLQQKVIFRCFLMTTGRSLKRTSQHSAIGLEAYNARNITRIEPIAEENEPAKASPLMGSDSEQCYFGAGVCVRVCSSSDP